MQIFFYQYFQYLSLIAAVICLRGLRSFHIAMLVLVIFLSCAADALGSVELSYLGTPNNYWIFNFYIILALPCYCILFNKMRRTFTKPSRIVTVIQIIAVAAVITNYLFIEGHDNFNTYSLIIFCIMNIVLSCVTLMQLALSDDIHTSLTVHPYFWICVGTLLFCLGTVVILGLQQYISANQIKYGGVNIYSPVMAILNIVMFSLYTYACLLCRYRKSKS